ncbi:MAG: MBL fold metallo-hydrolase [Dehalococcoidia bacterium]|nr:MBL fold metallo-hydrolase [Dehalococcoidia bacterium]
MRVLKYLGYTVILCVVISVLFVLYAPVFGGSQSTESLQRINNSRNFVEGKFANEMATSVSTRSQDRKSSIMDWVFQQDNKNPTKPLPSRPFNSSMLTEGKFAWLGHSTLIMKTNSVVMMTDPVFHRASPVPVIGNPFPVQHPISINDLPAVDAVIISHDHYDHLDHQAIRILSKRVDHFFVPLGVRAHLERWGVDSENITELDWYESKVYRGVRLTLAPARHFSGRGLWDRDSTLWGSWIISSNSLNVYFSGDSGYSDTFKTIGQRYGPFDIAFLENGAYNLDWAQIHLMPEETVQASIDLNARLLFPIHWSKFDLALHPWDEPAIRLTQEAKVRNVTVASPLIGEVFDIGNYPETRWWESLRAEIVQIISSLRS